MSKTADKKMVRLSEDVHRVVEAASDQGRRSITDQVDYVLRRVYGLRPVGVGEADAIIEQIRSGREVEVTPNLEVSNFNAGNG